MGELFTRENQIKKQLDLIKSVLFGPLFSSTQEKKGVPSTKEEFRALLEIANKALTNSPKENLLCSWIEQTCEEICQKPWGITIEKKITDAKNQIKENILPQKIDSSWLKTVLATIAIPTFLEIKKWKENNLETPQRRLEKIRETFPNYDPNNSEWQKKHLFELKKQQGYDLKKPTINTGETILKSIVIVGERHHEKENIEAQITLLKIMKKAGFTLLTLEEPEDTPWEGINTFLDTLITPKPKNEKEIIEQATLFSKTFEGSQQIALSKTLSLIAIAKKLGFLVACVDIKSQEKKNLISLQQKNRERNITQGEPLNPSQPSTALGGINTFKKEIEDSYQISLLRSKFIARKIEAFHKQGYKILHIGGLIHTFDIQDELGSILKKRPVGLQLQYKTKKQETPIATALGKTNPKNSKFSYAIESEKNALETWARKTLQIKTLGISPSL